MLLVPKRSRTVLGLLIATGVTAGCTGNPGGPVADQCSRGLSAAYRELNTAKVRGLDSTVEWSKAASLLTAAKIQYEFEHYPNCVEKVKRANVYLARIRR
jgi:hypothetical protein